MQRQLKCFFVAVTIFLPTGAFAAIGNDGIAKAETDKVAASDHPTSTGTSSASATEAAQFRQAGAHACTQAVDVISAIGEKFHQIAIDATELALNARDRYATEVEPKMHELRDRLREKIQRAEQLLSPPEQSAKR